MEDDHAFFLFYICRLIFEKVGKLLSKHDQLQSYDLLHQAD